MKLSPREVQLADAVMHGKSNGVIAAELGISVSTVREYLSRLYQKVGVGSRTGLAVWEYERKKG